MKKELFFAILTAVGEAKFAQAIANKTTINLTEIAVGDGGGEIPAPNRAQTTLINEQRRAPINTLSVDPVNALELIAEQIIPEDVGSWWIREIGLFDEDGDLCAVANCPPTYKPKMTEGSGRTQVIRLILAVTSTDVVKLKIDPSIVVASRMYVDERIKEVCENVDQAMQKVDEKFAPLESPVFVGAPNAPTADEDNNSKQLATTAFVQTIGQRYVTPKQGDERYLKRDEKLFPERGNGYQELPSGLILQWGYVAEPDPLGELITYPTPFPNAVFSIVATGAGGEKHPDETVNVLAQDNTAFKLFIAYTFGRVSTPCFWLALGC